jgi:hypothetical protein
MIRSGIPILRSFLENIASGSRTLEVSRIIRAIATCGVKNLHDAFHRHFTSLPN